MIGWDEGKYGSRNLHAVGVKLIFRACNRKGIVKGIESESVERMLVNFTVSCFRCRASTLSSIPIFFQDVPSFLSTIR